MKTSMGINNDKLIKREMMRPLSMKELLDMMPDVKIMKYKEFENVDDIDSFIDKYKKIILLYESKMNFGHWVALFKGSYDDEPVIEWFDSYGIFPDDERKFIPKEFLEYYEKVPHTVKLLTKSKYIKRYSQYKLQGNKTNTCGRWCYVRLRLSHVSEDKFNDLFTKNMPKGITPDYLVTLMSMII